MNAKWLIAVIGELIQVGGVQEVRVDPVEVVGCIEPDATDEEDDDEDGCMARYTAPDTTSPRPTAY